MALLSADLRAAVGAVEIHSASRYKLAGELREASEAIVAGGEPIAEPELERGLTDDLYYRLYCRAGARSLRRADSSARRDLVARLARANCSTGTWEPGWRVRGFASDGRVVVESAGVTFWAAPSELRPSGKEMTVGDVCRARVPAEYRELLPGYYMALGDADEAAEGPGPFAVRLYWHLRAAGAERWMRELTTELNRLRVPFRLKALSDPLAYLRADAGVLYLAPDQYPACREIIHRIWRRIHETLRPAAPLFTVRLAPGLGLAEGPDHLSFGRERCRLIAEAVVEAFAAGRPDMEDRCEAVAAAFRQAGLDPGQPHLAPGSTTSYEPFAAGAAAGRRETPQRRADRVASKGMTLLAAARGLGDTLCRAAYWQEDRCNWVGRAGDEGDPRTGIVVPTAAALRPGLYGGTAGIGLFLAHLHARVGGDVYRRTACGALRRAVAAVRAESDDGDPMSAFTGQLGIAWAAHQVAALAGDQELADWSTEMLERLARELPGDRRLDLIRGNSGAILVLLDLYRRTDKDAFLEAAVTLGEEIRAAAIREPGSWSWANDRMAGMDPAGPPITGLSHGTAGLALALLELYAMTGHQPCLEGAAYGFAYEDTWFDEDRGNWRDLRRRGKAGEGKPEFASAWCHGAPGITLSRLRAAAIDPDRAESYLATARAGLGTTRRLIENGLAQADADTSLCHGLFGLIEVVLVAGQVLDDEDSRAAALRAAQRIVDRHAPSGNWPSGVPSRGRNPSLLVGQAGVGYTLLRLEDPDRLPSVLLPGT